MRHSIVHPWFRSFDPDATPPPRRRLGFVVLVVGMMLVLLGDFVPFGRWLFAVGSCLMVLSLFLLGPYRFRAADHRDDIRKLRRHE